MKYLTKACLPFGLAVTSFCLLLSFAVEPATAAVKQDRCAEDVIRLTDENKQLAQDLIRAEAKMKALRSATDKPDPVAIIGGLGWIVGIFGGVAWFKSHSGNPRRKED